MGKAKARSTMTCQVPFCDGRTLPPLNCGHCVCSKCMLSIVKLSCPQFPLLVVKCPICRDKSGFCKWSFICLMHKHEREALLLECDGPSSGFCLVMQQESAEKVRTAFTFLPAAKYLHLLGEGEPFELQRLGEKMGEKASTIDGALQLVEEAEGENLPIDLL